MIFFNINKYEQRGLWSCKPHINIRIYVLIYISIIQTVPRSPYSLVGSHSPEKEHRGGGLRKNTGCNELVNFETLLFKFKLFKFKIIYIKKSVIDYLHVFWCTM